VRWCCCNVLIWMFSPDMVQQSLICLQMYNGVCATFL
jgi:hypothetical protein